MNKFTSLYLYGIIVILQGIFLIFYESSFGSFQIIRFFVGFTSVAGALFAFLTAVLRQKNNVQFAYHEMHALAMFVFGGSVLLFGKTLEVFTSLTAFLLFFYTFSELIFCIRIFDIKSNVVYKIVTVRVLLAVIIGVGTVLAMNTSTFAIVGFGILFTLIGVNIILYAPVMEVNQTSHISKG